MILWALAGCLPHGAAGRGADQEATVYEVALSAGAAPERISRQYAREFPDGTVSWLVCVQSTGRCVELRSFPTGEVVQLRGLGAWPAEERARYAGFWPIFSPHLDKDPDLFTGWPMGTVNRRPTRLVARGGWARQADAWSWAGTVGVQELPGISVAGKVSATIHVDRSGIRDGSWTLDLPWCASEGRCVPWNGGGTLTRVGTAPPRSIVPCPGVSGPPSRAPLCVDGGEPVEEPPGGLDLVSFLGADPSAEKTSTMEAEAPP